MDEPTFNSLVKQGYNRIPLMREVLADLDTPLSTYLKLANGPYSYLFESVQGGEKWGRYSIIGLPCQRVIKVFGHEVQQWAGKQQIESVTVDDPLAWVEAFYDGFKVAELEGLPRFNGGLVGYFGYDTIRYIEPRLAACPNPDELATPDILLMVSDEVVVFDNLSGKLHVIVHVDPAQAGAYQQGQARLDKLVKQLDQPVHRHVAPRAIKVEEGDFISGFTQQGYEDAVRRIKEYIVEGVH